MAKFEKTLVDGVQVRFSDTIPSGMAFTPDSHCQFCGAQQPIVSIGSVAGGIISDMTFRCVQCGKENKVSGSYEATVGDDGTLKMVLHDLTLSQLVDLRARLADVAANPDATVEEVSAAVGPVSPQLVRWLAVPENRKEVRETVTLLLVGIGVIISLMTYNNSKAPSPAVVEKVVVQIENRYMSDTGLPRRAPCWCGSEKRYKNCHGLQTSSSEVPPIPPSR